MNIGILGTGFGSYHAQLFKKMKKIDRVVVFGRNQEKLHELKEKVGVETTNQIDTIMSDPEIDLIDICLPSTLHRQYAVEALERGKNVFCETPVCLSLEDAEVMIQAQERFSKTILVNQFIKFDPAYAYLHTVNQQQKYGRLLSLSLKRETAPLWGNLGLDSITLNLMIHELDFVTWIMGTTNNLDVWGQETADKQQALVKAAFDYSHAYAEVIASSQMPRSYPFTIGYEAYFERAKLVYHESDENGETHAYLHAYTQSGREEIALMAADPYQKSLEHAIWCIQNDQESMLSLQNAVLSLKTALELKTRLQIKR
ncbi:oxidoreductase [Brevibacillus reuszeri]|uniref:Dehydrogenase n=1 Tax=Brevibacillus reuszeri TaxID=54915 RepID=A0A0K9Z101_9BACL|nr:Gfo/Idh/MocA family oxidoreductase [Brevibacillus reuszeri]KNB74606.1 dehydrogenase [Brevibacillus reuszeri]MED1856544.1 Gfo/Idh/MocA family oxidoreductase [Brevibacillus reuszeri]GED67757.1 oxidoreductase [Brevibacillus reuszeri]